MHEVLKFDKSEHPAWNVGNVIVTLKAGAKGRYRLCTTNPTDSLRNTWIITSFFELKRRTRMEVLSPLHGVNYIAAANKSTVICDGHNRTIWRSTESPSDNQFLSFFWVCQSHDIWIRGNMTCIQIMSTYANLMYRVLSKQQKFYPIVSKSSARADTLEIKFCQSLVNRCMGGLTWSGIIGNGRSWNVKSNSCK